MNSEPRDTKNRSRKPSFRFWFYLGLAATLLVWSSAAEAEDVVVTDADGSPWTITINPGASYSTASSAQFVPPLPATSDAGREVAVLGASEQSVLAPVAASAAQDPGIEIHSNHNGAVVDGRSYAEIYRSIPYSKTEYYANPSYRHDATMEILFGELRPGGGNNGRTGRVIENPVAGPYRPYLFTDWTRPRPYYPPYWSGFSWPGFGHGFHGGPMPGGGGMIGGPGGGPGGIGIAP